MIKIWIYNQITLRLQLKMIRAISGNLSISGKNKKHRNIDMLLLTLGNNISIIYKKESIRCT